MDFTQALIGFRARQASTSFTQIVGTEGRDISNLMVARGELRKLYSLQDWLILAGTALLILDFIVPLLLGGDAAPTPWPGYSGTLL